MIVLDASFVVELLTNGELANSLKDQLMTHDDSFAVPHLLAVEVLSAIRRLIATQRIDSHRTEQLLTELALLSCRTIFTHSFAIEDLGTTPQFHLLRCGIYCVG